MKLEETFVSNIICDFLLFLSITQVYYRSSIISQLKGSFLTLLYTSAVKESDSSLWEKFRTVYFWANKILINRI